MGFEPLGDFFALCGRAWEIREFRWAAIASVPVLWFGVAWGDLRMLLLVPLMLGGAALVQRLHPSEPREQKRSDDDDWL
jgi:hypothetical protein